MNGTPTPEERAAAEALRDELARRLAAAAWMEAPAPAGWDSGEAVR